MSREILELTEVQKMEKMFQENPESSAYRIDGIKLLKKWKAETDLIKEDGVKELIDRLLAEYDIYN